ncbi:Uncharacterized protein Fot_35435 [Forsythia ovata]|uniref:Uncharacterized protein n=1 Tax=Forsythia ovata TaxID=205694 RepID=A0ABD1SLH8_9LAMI
MKRNCKAQIEAYLEDDSISMENTKRCSTQGKDVKTSCSSIIYDQHISLMTLELLLLPAKFEIHNMMSRLSYIDCPLYKYEDEYCYNKSEKIAQLLFNPKFLGDSRKNITAATEGSSKAPHPPSNEVVINEPSARPSSQPTLKEFACKEKVPPKVPGDKVLTKPLTIARPSTSTSSAHEKGASKGSTA